MDEYDFLIIDRIIKNTKKEKKWIANERSRVIELLNVHELKWK